jgi:hypothetical protein
MTAACKPCRHNIAPHDLETKTKQLEDFLSKGRQVAVSVTYETRAGKWKEQYPKAVQVCSLMFHASATLHPGRCSLRLVHACGGNHWDRRSMQCAPASLIMQRDLPGPVMARC